MKRLNFRTHHSDHRGLQPEGIIERAVQSPGTVDSDSLGNTCEL
jgi:hypothetical protein